VIQQLRVCGTGIAYVSNLPTMLPKTIADSAGEHEVIFDQQKVHGAPGHSNTGILTK
jgi:hypothetical protein